MSSENPDVYRLWPSTDSSSQQLSQNGSSSPNAQACLGKERQKGGKKKGNKEEKGNKEKKGNT
ncbi:hypothetical protein Pyn_10388 [Prunus yedoensis var. nudiflora]|uniref:Uncharacterized protein n=1 Tax=Prunus yedoensis var. nudiflora TaxID=2094558 RepID=A0A314XS04_PRUYE|nr:hypothetical protein Pyn_10388 [Prunus yedoensis var. nudiflora]